MHTKAKTNSEPHKHWEEHKTINQQQHNYRIRTDSSLSYWGGGGGGVNAFYWRQIFTLDSAIVNTRKLFSSQGGFITYAMHHHGETI